MATLNELLRPGSAESAKILNMLRSNFDLSYRHMSVNYDPWDELEGSYRAYRLQDDEDIESEQKYGVRKIAVPIQFATLQIVLTFFMEIFTAVPPRMKVKGSDPASIKPAQVMELCLDYDYRGNRGYFTWMQFFLNILRYGIGVAENTWGEKFILRKQLIPAQFSRFTIEGNTYNVPGGQVYENAPFKTFEGNTWKIIDPRLFFPDPRKSLANFQQGIFAGHRFTIHDLELEEEEDSGLFFNVDYVKRGTVSNLGRGGEGGAADHNRDRWRGSPYLETAISDAKRDGTHIGEQQIVKIIPRDYKLSREDRPQYWRFITIDGEVIVHAEESPFSAPFPYVVGECFPDELAFMSQGMMELTQPLAKHINFLFNSHMANVRRMIKDLLLVDPSRIEMRDLLESQDGGFVRLTEKAFGQDPAQFAKQLQITDVTSGHFDAVERIMQLWERITGANSSLFGQISTGRRTALELQGVFRSSGARMKMMADSISSQAMAPWTEQCCIMRQENMTEAQFMEIAGKTAFDLGVTPNQIIDGFIKVYPRHINGVFNFPAEDGVLPQDRAAAADMMNEMLDRVSSNPWLSQMFDIGVIFKEMVRQRGLGNLSDFLNSALKTDVMILTPDQLAEMSAQKLLTPLGSPNGGRPNKGVREERETLSMEGATNGAGASYA